MPATTVPRFVPCRAENCRLGKRYQGSAAGSDSEYMGHGSPVITKPIYVDVADELHREALDQLGALFADGGGNPDA